MILDYLLEDDGGDLIIAHGKTVNGLDWVMYFGGRIEMWFDGGDVE